MAEKPVKTNPTKVERTAQQEYALRCIEQDELTTPAQVLARIVQKYGKDAVNRSSVSRWMKKWRAIGDNAQVRTDLQNERRQALEVKHRNLEAKKAKYDVEAARLNALGAVQGVRRAEQGRRIRDFEPCHTCGGIPGNTACGMCKGKGYIPRMQDEKALLDAVRVERSILSDMDPKKDPQVTVNNVMVVCSEDLLPDGTTPHIVHAADLFLKPGEKRLIDE